MSKLIQGVIRFMKDDFNKQKRLFENLKSEQTPHTLFVGCSDSRVVPNLITGTFAGELFVVRNIANIIPHYRQSDEYLATTSAIEYAIDALNVENIVVCGHSNCGGCESIYKKDKLDKMPTVAKWLTQLNDIKEELDKIDLDEDERHCLTERLNIIMGLENLKTFPHVKEKIEQNKLKLHGWHYIIESGEVFAYDGNNFNLIKG